MSKLDDFPPDIVVAARTALQAYLLSSDTVEVAIAKAIAADRASRRQPKFGGLTAHQKRVFEYLRSFTAEQGICPSYEQIQKFLGLSSKSGVHRVIGELEERGVITRLPNRSRSITIIAQIAT